LWEVFAAGFLYSACRRASRSLWSLPMVAASFGAALHQQATENIQRAACLRKFPCLPAHTHLAPVGAWRPGRTISWEKFSYEAGKLKETGLVARTPPPPVENRAANFQSQFYDRGGSDWQDAGRCAPITVRRTAGNRNNPFHAQTRSASLSVTPPALSWARPPVSRVDQAELELPNIVRRGVRPRDAGEGRAPERPSGR